ncbi:CDP-diacylglycerol--glycerol-3-phosphate 3-phosphatidyltransferase [Jonesiaceae bacterium BS-20]|uniref:CDP-diacylglycerol--glycerol-3-phosphate 3-phosphatidyltransferase n=1 Tax=Jonesiaceae bacterium BS-20 TaxID=3120821 RepID=A0AAU7DZ25_9MICO
MKAGRPLSAQQGSSQQASPWNIANILTMIRIAMVPVFVWALLQESGDSVMWRLIALGIFVTAAATDKLDGYLARSRGLITDLGKILDPIADKVLIGAALIGLSILGDLWWWVTIAILGRELIVTLMRFIVIKYVVLPASRGGKVKTVLQVIAISAFLLPLAAMPYAFFVIASVLMGAAVAVTVYTGIEYLFVGYRAFVEGRNSDGK